ncbi:hypothetical protein [Dictyobacter formicarum]|uniref:Uncharacterized protein n=1 Tax=Dictyobacter formicarum TaxID=2778368 RepID=A0ABQ3VQN7_9CHLR|nr:hypothetical protein [Dictyobacter formicarum]GHO88310.1 hypothetical protein KSZ_63160 [Dictyobacter formicarum]
MPLFIVVAYDMAQIDGCLGIVAWATTEQQANMIVKAFGYASFCCRSSLVYCVRSASSASLYGPECTVNLLEHWELSMY